MKIELTSDQIHWLKYALISTIRNLPADDDKVRQILSSVLNKLDETGTHPSVDIRECLLDNGKVLLILPAPLTANDREQLHKLVELIWQTQHLKPSEAPTEFDHPE